MPDWYSLVRSLTFNASLTYTEADIDIRYSSQFGNQAGENGPYHGKIVNFPDNPPYLRHTRVGVRHDGFNGMTPIYYVRLEHIEFVGDKPIETILREYAQRNEDFQDIAAARAIYTEMCKAHAQEAVVPGLSHEGQEHVLSEIIGPMRSYGELRVREDRQAIEERIEKWLKDHGVEVRIGYRSLMDQTIVQTIKHADNIGIGETLDEALFNWIEQLLE